MRGYSAPPQLCGCAETHDGITLLITTDRCSEPVVPPLRFVPCRASSEGEGSEASTVLEKGRRVPAVLRLVGRAD